MFANWFRRAAGSGARKPQRRAAPLAQLRLEALEDRLPPAHLNPGVGEVVLPAAAAHGAHGIETANEAPRDHRGGSLELIVH